MIRRYSRAHSSLLGSQSRSWVGSGPDIWVESWSWSWMGCRSKSRFDSWSCGKYRSYTYSRAGEDRND